MLEQRQLVGVLTGGVDQFGHERPIDTAAEHLRRADDGALHLRARQPGREVLGPIDRIGQVGEAHAIAEKIGGIVRTT